MQCEVRAEAVESSVCIYGDTVLQNLGDDSDSDDEDYPSSDSDSEPDEDRYSIDIIDIEHTDDESESDWSEHSSDDGFIDAQTTKIKNKF